MCDLENVPKAWMPCLERWTIAGPPGFWDPLGLADMDMSLGFSPGATVGNEATIGFLRHAEIKHGRVAMAGFLGFCAQSTPLISGEHTFAPYSGYVAGCTPQVQWDNIPLFGKLQIFTLIGMLESYGEGARAEPGDYVHYMKGGQPGYFPPIKGKSSGQISFNLYDPFNWGHRAMSADKKASWRSVATAEINHSLVYSLRSLWQLY